MLKKTNIDFSVLRFSDDHNVLLNSPKKTENIKLGDKQEYSASIPDRGVAPYDNNITLLKFFFRASPSITIIDRSYQKLTAFLANMGGNKTIIMSSYAKILSKETTNQKLNSPTSLKKIHIMVKTLS